MGKLISLKDARKKNNDAVLEKFHSGDGLSKFSTLESWWPKRQIIKKDKAAMKSLYNKEEPKK